MSRKFRIRPVALALLLAWAVYGAAARAESSAQQAASATSPEPVAEHPEPKPASPSAAAESPAEQPAASPPATPPAGQQPTELATPPPAPAQQSQEAAPQATQQAASMPIPGAAEQAGLEQAAPPYPRFKVEAVGFRAVDESGANYPDADIVFAVFESQQHSMTTRVFEEVDTGDARTFDAAENCIYPARDPDGLRNGAWECSAEGADGPVTFAIGLYEIDPEYVDGYSKDFCTPAAVADVDAAQRTCDTDNTDLIFRSAFSYRPGEIVNRLNPACRCVMETVRYRDRNERGDVEYHLTFRITRTDAGGAPPAVDPSAGRDVYRSGARSAALGQGFELDGGVSAAIAPDLAFSGAPAAPMLTPSGGAKIWPGDANARGFDACYAERRSANYVTSAVTAPRVGQYACYVTNNGRVGELRIDHLTISFNTAVLSLSYTTWQ